MCTYSINALTPRVWSSLLILCCHDDDGLKFAADAQLLQRHMLFMTWCSEVHCKGAVAADPHWICRCSNHTSTNCETLWGGAKKTCTISYRQLSSILFCCIIITEHSKRAALQRAPTSLCMVSKPNGMHIHNFPEEQNASIFLQNASS